MRKSALLVIAAITASAWSDRARAETVYGITNLQELVVFDSNVRSVTSTVGLSGFSITGELLLSIDLRPATGELYGLSNQNKIYKINPLTGSRAQVGGVISPALTGGLRAMDFNPTVDRIRLLGSSGAVTNLRFHPDTGAVTEDADLAFLAGDVNQGKTPAVVNGAYTNSFPGAKTTTLFDLEAGNDILAKQTPANDGTLSTVGSLGLNLATSGGFTGFDISGATGTAFLVGNNLTGGITSNNLYSVNLATGLASSLGAITGVNGTFRDIAVVPEPATWLTGIIGGVAVLLARWRRK